MKKLLSLFLTLSMLLGVLGALAEDAATTELATLPDGTAIVLNHEGDLTIDVTYSDDNGRTRWFISDGVHSPLVLSIAPSEIESELSLGDLTEEQQLSYGQEIGQCFANPKVHLDTTPSGNKYVHITSNETFDTNIILTIYKGYCVEMMQFWADYTPLTDEDNAFFLSVLHGIEFVPAAQ